MGRPRDHGEATAARLLDAAATVLASEGPAAVSVRRLAAEAGTTTRAIYSLFGSKEGVLRAVVRAGFDGLAAELDAVPTGGDPSEELRALALAYRRSALARPRLYEAQFGASGVAITPGPEDAEVALGTLQRLADAVARCQTAGSIAGDDPWPPTRALWATVHGLTTLELRGALGTADDAEVTWTLALAAIEDGLAP